ncbi:MAG: DinB family protein [Acidobacteria bacterium]|nr:MAG: DinB family protein [Acidobacteriota bacterium]REK02023.1 MAG: DinB family protein [Acidobacteriota bacterium]REK14981.1 MAG: DinB family protein [Acidobacteriota bacterium]REK45695.1 MAG: DinB family protein [Acidobacteriota bacterium]
MDDHRISEFNSKRQALLDRLSDLDDDVLTSRPIEGKWSVIEIVEHMVVAEREVMMGLPEKDRIKVYNRSLKNKVMLKVVMFVLGRIRVKVPSKTMLPKGEQDLTKLRALWDENQEWFRRYVESCDEAALENAVFKHPVAGPINVRQAVDMSIAHLDAHSEQIETLLKTIGNSK